MTRRTEAEQTAIDSSLLLSKLLKAFSCQAHIFAANNQNKLRIEPRP